MPGGGWIGNRRVEFPDEGEPLPGTAADYLFAHRVERYLAIGFSEASAQALAAVKDRHGVPLHWLMVKRALDSGCTHTGALEIFT